MTRIVTVPDRLWRSLSVNWDIDWGDQSAGVTNADTRQVYYSRFPKWVGRLEASLHHRNIGIWQAAKVYGQGRSALYRLHVLNPAAFDVTEANGGANRIQGVPYSGGVRHDTGQGFELDPLCRVSGTVSLGATEFRVDTTQAGVAPRLGQIMSHGTGHNNWPFMVTGVFHVSGNLYDISVQMPLRAALADGDAIRMRAVGLFEAAGDFSGNTEYGARRQSVVSLSFREYINR